MLDISLMPNTAVLMVLGDGAWHSIKLETEGWGQTQTERGTDGGRDRETLVSVR